LRVSGSCHIHTIPTDLTVQSLAPIHRVVQDAGNEKIIIRLVHLLSLPTSIAGLLLSEENKPHSAVSDNFIEAYQMLQYKYNHAIEKIVFNFVYCSTSRYLNNYMQGNHIGEVYMPDNYSYMQPLDQSEKFETMIKRCKVPLIKVPFHSGVLSEHQALSTLLAGYSLLPDLLLYPIAILVDRSIRGSTFCARINSNRCHLFPDRKNGHSFTGSL
jgi:hypothetical protein